MIVATKNYAGYVCLSTFIILNIVGFVLFIISYAPEESYKLYEACNCGLATELYDAKCELLQYNYYETNNLCDITFNVTYEDENNTETNMILSYRTGAGLPKYTCNDYYGLINIGDVVDCKLCEAQLYNNDVVFVSLCAHWSDKMIISFHHNLSRVNIIVVTLCWILFVAIVVLFFICLCFREKKSDNQSNVEMKNNEKV